MTENISNEKINKAVDSFTKEQTSSGATVRKDSIFNGVNSAGKGDAPRNISNTFKQNFEDIFPNSYKPKWMQDLENE